MKNQGVDVVVGCLRDEYAAEHALEVPGRSRRLLALLDRVMWRARFHLKDSDVARQLYTLGMEITMEIAARARGGTEARATRLSSRYRSP